MHDHYRAAVIGRATSLRGLRLSDLLASKRLLLLVLLRSVGADTQTRTSELRASVECFDSFSFSLAVPLASYSTVVGLFCTACKEGVKSAGLHS